MKKKKFSLLMLLGSGILIASCGSGGGTSLSINQTSSSVSSTPVSSTSLNQESSSSSTSAEDNTPVYDYTNIQWTWTGNDTDGYTAAKATIHCTNGKADDMEVTATITSEKKDETCTEDGKITYTATIEVDGNTYTDKKEVTLTKLGHSYNLSAIEDNSTYWTWEKSSANSTYTATLKIPCIRDDHTEVINASVTKDTENSRTATHTEDGQDVYIATATFENQTFTSTKIDTIAKLGHNYDFVSFDWVGNETDGYTACNVNLKCSDDDATSQVPATSFVEDDGHKDASCTEDGYVSYTATYGDHSDTKTAKKVEKLGHDFSVDVNGSYKEATYYEEGKEVSKQCSRCEEVQEGNPIPKKTLLEETKELSSDQVTDSGIKSIVYIDEEEKNKIKYFDQTDTGPCYKTVEKDGNDVQALYFSHKAENTEYSELRFALDKTDLYNSISFDYRYVDFNKDVFSGGADDGDGYHSFIQRKDASGKYFAANVPNTVTKPNTLNNDGKWHNLTLTLDHEEWQNLLIKIYHFQGELIISNFQVSTQRQAREALAKKYEGSHTITTFDSETLNLMKEAGYTRIHARISFKNLYKEDQLKSKKEKSKIPYVAIWDRWSDGYLVDPINYNYDNLISYDLTDYLSGKQTMKDFAVVVDGAPIGKEIDISNVTFTESEPSKEEAKTILNNWFIGTHLVNYLPLAMIKKAETTSIRGKCTLFEDYPDTYSQANIRVDTLPTGGQWGSPYEAWVYSSSSGNFSIKDIDVTAITDMKIRVFRALNTKTNQEENIGESGYTFTDLHFE